MTRRNLRIQIFKLLFRVEFNSPEDMPEQVRLFLMQMNRQIRKHRKKFRKNMKRL